MKWKIWNRRSKEKLKEIEKERQEWLNRIKKEGVNPSYKPPHTIGITCEPPPTTASGITCPRCGSTQVREAGYGNRFECTNCERIFT